MMMMRCFLLLVLCTVAHAFTTSTTTGTLEGPSARAKSTSNALLRTKGFAVHGPTTSSPPTTVQCRMGLLDDMSGLFKRFTQKASASHILIKGGAEAENQLEDLKVEIDNNPVKFAAAAAKYSACPSAQSGGDLGEFGPGAMVREFDQVVFNEPVGVVHGPIKTQFGYHLIYIRDRTE